MSKWWIVAGVVLVIGLIVALIVVGTQGGSGAAVTGGAPGSTVEGRVSGIGTGLVGIASNIAGAFQ